jgi:alpha-glucuronidase
MCRHANINRQFARALAPHDGTIFFRAFVYDHLTLNESNWKADRANAAVDFFEGLDDKFAHNVVVQIKHGPIDFQVREPVSPLFTHLRQTPTVNELEITQEYMGQQAHLVYLAPYWKEILDTDLRVDNESTPLSSILSGRRFATHRGGYAGVANVGMNSTWLGSHLAMSNLYAFGKLAWNPAASPSDILDSWTRLTFSHDQRVIDTINTISMVSWPMYENYTGNLGIQTLTDILNAHYGPNPLSQDNNPWGQWTRTDALGVGMDRTTWNGTGFAGQYPPALTARYNDVNTTPDNLLLWFHHVPYSHVLHSGLTVIQHFYDAHYAGAATAQTFPTHWRSLESLIDPERYEHVLFRLAYQAGHSLVWRDSIVDFYLNRSSIPDSHGRAGHHPFRLEAEAMNLTNYSPYLVNPFYSASGSYAIVTTSNTTTGTASTLVPFEDGTYDITVSYYDQAIGNATWELWLDDSQVGTWKGDLEYVLGKAPTFYIDGQTAVRKKFDGVEVEKGQEVKIVGKADGMEPAAVDFVEFERVD